jgi:asparagine synthetase B (glutamine-hydrolysing)
VILIEFPTDTGAQPLLSEDGKIILAVNGEIYNHLDLRESVGPNVIFKTNSDCEVIIPLVRVFNQSFNILSHHLIFHISVPKIW